MSPVADPLSYPGRLPARPVLLVGDRFVDLALVSPDLLDEDRAGRHAVLAVGSNAGRARLVEKLAHLPGEQVVPVVPCEVEGMAVGFTPMVASYGSVPYTAVPGDGLRCRTYVQFLDDEQLAVLDASEQPAYWRDLLGGLRVVLPTGAVLHEAWAYVCDRGALVDDDGALVPLQAQASVLAVLAGWFPDLVPADAEEAVAALIADPGRRRAVAEALRRTGRVRALPPA